MARKMELYDHLMSSYDNQGTKTKEAEDKPIYLSIHMYVDGNLVRSSFRHFFLFRTITYRRGKSNPSALSRLRSFLPTFRSFQVLFRNLTGRLPIYLPFISRIALR